jgi:DNA-binding NarL/FixJ family response regulator
MTTDDEFWRRNEHPPAPQTDDIAPANAGLRARFIDSDARHGAVSDCSDVWQSLRAGSLFVVDTFSTEERAYLVLQWRASETPRVTTRRWEILERVLLGESQKVLAIELRAAPSTIAASSKSALRAIGVGARVSSVPPLLCLLVHASRKRGALDPIRSACIDRGNAHYRVLSIGLRSSALAERLSPAEQVVAMMRIQGRSLAEIATCRHTSTRTVANQLSTVFRRLGLSGRSSLVGYFLHPQRPALVGNGP